MRNVSAESKYILKEDVRFLDIIQDVFALCAERIKNKDIELRLSMPSSELDPWIYCDRVQISQVLLNLLNNAYDATEGHKGSWIEVLYVEDAEYDVIHVKNSGEKIANEIVPKLFTPFFTTKDVGKGTGLGLSISKSIMENHHGSLELLTNSEYTCFVVKLPKSPHKEKQ